MVRVKVCGWKIATISLDGYFWRAASSVAIISVGWWAKSSMTTVPLIISLWNGVYTWEGFKVFRNQAHVKTGYIEVPNNRSCIQDIVTTIGWHMEFSKDLSIMFHLKIRPCRCTHNVCCYKVIIFFETIVIDWRIGCNLTRCGSSP